MKKTYHWEEETEPQEREDEVKLEDAQNEMEIRVQVIKDDLGDPRLLEQVKHIEMKGTRHYSC